LNDGSRTSSYDQANRLKTLARGANSNAFAYNGLGDRLSQTVGVTTTRYALDPAAGLTEMLADGASTYRADALGSVRQIYNSSRQIIFNKRYDPFGNQISQSDAGSRP
jgi:hypothetical protein